jgi:dTDP-4-dehydrorhamnose reductase
MRVLILGGTGMLGHRLWINLNRTHETWVTVRGSAQVFPDHADFDRAHVRENVDALNFDEVTHTLANVQPDLVINCIGLIKQQPQAKDPLAALQLNAVFPHRVALACQLARIRMIHIGTDCVFSGNKGNYVEGDPSDATDLYGRTKFLGEVAYPDTITLRTSFIGPELKSRLGLLEWFLSQRQGVKGFQKAIYSGLTADELSRVIRDYVVPYPELNGVYHVSSAPISKYELLKLFNRAYGRGLDIEPDTAFVCDRSLDSSRFRAATGYTPPSWPEMIEAMATLSAPYYIRDLQHAS